MENTKHDRSSAYPVIDLETAVKRLNFLSNGLGKGPYSREDAVKGMGYSGLSGASARAVAALVQYGLLLRKGNTYSLSQMSADIIHPENDQQKINALKKAAVTPRIFNQIASNYDGQSLPTMLENILIRMSISPKYAKLVASNLKASFEYTGILINGVVAMNSDDNTDVSAENINSTTEELDKKVVKSELKNSQSGFPIVLGPDITIMLSDKLVREVALGVHGTEFATAMENLKKFAGKEIVNREE